VSDDNRPVPNPMLTTEQLFREIAALEKIITTRLDAMDRAIVLFNDNLTRVPTETDKQVGHLKELVQEQLTGIQRQFEERKDGLAVALSAAKEAVEKQNQSSALAIAKSEAATDKRIDGLVTYIESTSKARSEQINDLKDRLTRIESRTEGALSARTSQQDSGKYIIAIIGAMVGLGGFIIAWMRVH
jgi:hypothetical protein